MVTLKTKFRLPVSVTTCKKLLSCHPQPYNKKKDEQTENQQLFLEPSVNEVGGQTVSPKSTEMGKSRELQPRSASMKQKQTRDIN